MRDRSVMLEARETLALELAELETIGSFYEFGACEQPVEYRSCPAYARNPSPCRDTAFDGSEIACPIFEVDSADAVLAVTDPHVP